jgi:uncharacterized protein YjbJ (UPF0337 family)
MLNQEQIKTLWPEIKGGLRNLWGRLSEEELDHTEGDLSAVASLVEEKYTEEKNEIRAKLDHLMKSFDNETDKGHDPDVASYHRMPFNEDWNPRH